MKRIIYIAIIILTVSSCGNNGKYDAQGTFEATEVVVSSEAAGRILSFDIEEGMPVKAGIVVGKIDSLQLLLQHKQLSAQLSALLDSRPDTKAQVASLREQIDKQKSELRRVKNMLNDGAATKNNMTTLRRIYVFSKVSFLQRSLLLTKAPLPSIIMRRLLKHRWRLWQTESQNAV